MNLDERNQISVELSKIIERFKSLEEQPINSPPPWPKIRQWINEAHGFFNEVLEAFIKPCENYLEEIKSDPRDFDQWQSNLADLWERLDFLRGVHNRAFCHDYTSIIYQHIFIEEMFECLPDKLGGARLKFLLLPSGDLIVWPMKDAFYQLAPTWFPEKALETFDKLRAKETIVCFECHRDRNFERQAVLAHEIIHIIVRNNAELGQALRTIAEDPDVRATLQASNSESLSQTEELFCDYAATWFYGPVYLQAFAEEISHYPVAVSDTHPAADLRAKFLLESHIKFKTHRGYKLLQQYYKLRRQHDIPKPAQLRKLAEKFENALTSLNLDKYAHVDQSVEISRSFEHNIPAVAKDIRTFINNLPQRQPDEDIKRHGELVSESLRKTNLLRQIKNHILEPDALFSMPAALTRVSKKRKS